MALRFFQKLKNPKVTGVILAALAGLFFAFLPVAHADFIPLPDTTNLDVPAPEGDSAFEKLANLLGPLARNLRIIVAAVAVMFIVISGATMVISGDNEETEKNQKKSLTYGLIGLLMISIAGPVAEVFDYRGGNFLSDPNQLVERVTLFDNTTQLIITFVKYLLGGLASLMFIRAGALMVMYGDQEDEIGKQKKNLALGAGGLLLVMVSDLVVRRVFYIAEFNEDADKTIVKIDQNEFLTQLVAITNFIVTWVGPIMMLGIVAGGFLYLTSAGDEERMGMAKKIVTNSIIGVIVIYGAFALVSTVIAGSF